MTVAQPRLFPFAALCGLALLFADAAHAQLPAGCAVVGTFSGPISTGTSGVFLVQLPSGAVTPVTGLPSYLQPTGPTSTQQGASSVAYRSSDGAIVVGTVAAAGGPTGGAVELFLFYLTGSAVNPALTRRIQLGTTTGTAGAVVTVLPEDDILVVAGPLTTGPMAGTGVAIVHVDASTPTTVTPLPTPTSTGVGGGAAIDASGLVLYYALTVGINTASPVAQLHRWTMGASPSCVIATWPNHIVKGICCDDDGAVYVSMNDLTTFQQSVVSLHPNGCTPVPSTAVPSSPQVPPSGVALDRASGLFLMAATGWAPAGWPTAGFNSLFLVDPASGASILLTPPPAGGWGLMGGVAVHNAIDSYGSPSDGLNHYWLENFPNPGGLPTPGNAGFSLTLRSTPGTAMLSVLGLSLGRGSLSVPSIDILIDLNTAAMILVPAGPSVTVPLPIPNAPILAGLELTAQSLHLEPGFGLAASRGLTF